MATTIAIILKICYNESMKELENMLDALGLEYQESKVYLQSLSLGTSRASIIAKRCKLPRSTARFTCEQLVEKQLMIESQKGNAKLFTPENPQKLRKLLDLQQEQLKSRSQELDVKMQDLLRLYNPYTVIPKARFYEGVDGIIEMFEDFLEEDTPFYGMTGASGVIHPQIVKYLAERYVPRRKEWKKGAWMLFNYSERIKTYRKQDKAMNRTSLIAPEMEFPFPALCHIYRGKVAFYSYFQQDMTGIIIENPLIFTSMTSLFKMAWNDARKMDINKQYASAELPDLSG